MRLWIFCFLVLVGCEQVIKNHRENNPANFICTADQMKLVEDQTVFCSVHTSYSSAGCYLQALARNCRLKGVEQ